MNEIKKITVATEIEINKIKIDYDIEIKIRSKTRNCIFASVSGKGSAFDLYIVTIEVSLFNFTTYMIAIPAFNYCIDNMSLSDKVCLNDYLYNIVENNIDRNTIITALISLYKKELS